MKKYLSLGELLIDYRKLNSISQADFAASLNVDIRTVSRWEKDITLIKSEKEEELVEQTFIPYQVIRNLNAAVAIPTYYDFFIRKYSLTELSNDLPDASWFLDQMNKQTKRMRTIEYESDFENIFRYTRFQHSTPFEIDKELIRQATKLLPELNFIIFDDAGYYAGHCVFFPINQETNNKLRNHQMKEWEINLDHLVDPRKGAKTVFHNYDVAADCNENIFYVFGAVLRFFKKLEHSDHLYSSLVIRPDTRQLNEALGIELIWEDKEEEEAFGMEFPPRFYEGEIKWIFENLGNTSA